MKLAIDDQILKTFTDFKFRKIDARYLTFKISKDLNGKEHIVNPYIYRRLIPLAKERRHGMIF
jgi:hypothetical protein